MRIDIAEEIISAARDMGTDINLHEDYSGRGMYGDTTAAISGDLNNIIAAVAMAASTLQDNHRKLEDLVVAMQNISTDSYARQIIVY